MTTTYATTCGTYRLAGGYGVLGNNAKISKSYTNLNPHLKARITFYVIKIGNWINNKFFVDNGSTELTSLTFSTTEDSTAYKICGSNSFTEALRPVNIYFDHSDNTMDLSIFSDLTLTAADSSWGIFDLSITIYLCHSTCKTCALIDLASQCMTCEAGLYLQASGPAACLSTCPSDSYEYDTDQTCKSCISDCKTCNGGTLADCMSCETTYLQSLIGPAECKTTCPSHTYMDSSTYICQNCDTSCAECTASDTTKCTSCPNGSYLQSLIGPAECKNTCPTHTFTDTSTNICQNCEASCIECSASGITKCSSCSGGSYLQSLIGPAECKTTCPTHTYKDNSTYICQNCDASCTECTVSGTTKCTSCPSGSYLQSLTGLAECKNTCPTHTYTDSSTNICQNCDASCTECSASGTTKCNSCMEVSYYCQLVLPLVELLATWGFIQIPQQINVSYVMELVRGAMVLKSHHAPVVK